MEGEQIIDIYISLTNQYAVCIENYKRKRGVYFLG